jgi:hypothetical protein
MGYTEFYYARWWGRDGTARCPPIPINAPYLIFLFCERFNFSLIGVLPGADGTVSVKHRTAK